MGHNKKYSCLQETTNLISYNEDVLALRIKISSLRTIFVTREDKDESPERTRASHPGEQGRVTREDKDESPGRIRTSHPGGQGRVTREDKDESPGRTRASHPGGLFRVSRKEVLGP